MQKCGNIRNDNIPDTYRTYLGECDSGNEPLSQECFLQIFGLKNVSNTIVQKWMQNIGFTYDERRKSYFSDKHEDKENILSRKKFIKKYFDLERRTHRWVQIPESLAIEMEGDNEKPLMRDFF